jgi:three-Cys-motif partner protein
MPGKNNETTDNANPLESLTAPDPCPTLIVERGPDEKGVGAWVPNEKHRLLRHYLDASRYARRKWSSRVFIDPFSGPGRIQVAGEPFTRPGGAVLAYEASTKDAPFTKMFIGDLDNERAHACERRLTIIGASARSFPGPAAETIKAMVSAVPSGSLCTAFVDPYNLEVLSFSILEELARLRKIDLAINFSTMDLQRNVELEFDPERARFDDVAPGWRIHPPIRAASRPNVKLAFFSYWCDLVKGLGFEHSQQMPLVRNNQGHGIYRMVFFSRHDFPKGIWDDVARDPRRTLDMFDR